MCISTRALKKYYGSHLGIESVDLEVEKGAFYGFIGPNGAGKSTTLKLLMSILFPTSGEALMNGYDVTQFEMRIKPFIGFLPAEVHLYSEVTVKSLFEMNIQYYSKLKLKDGLIRFQNKKRAQLENICMTSNLGETLIADEVQNLYTLSEFERKKFLESELQRLTQYLQVDVNKKFKELSFGNQKKVGYILSVLHNPEVVLLDEPTNGLDPLIKERIFEDLTARNKRGVTIFFSSHNLDEVERHCTKVAFIKEGKIIKITTIESLKALALKNVILKVSDDHAKETMEILSKKYKVEQRDNIGHAVCISFQLTKAISELLKDLAELELLDLNIESPTLEEIFKYYY